MTFKAAIFDMDGTLLDSMALWDNVGTFFLSREGINSSFVSPGLSLRRVAKAISDEYPQFSADYTLKGLHDVVNKFYETAEIKPFVPEYLATLKAAGIPICLATVTERIHAETVLRRHDIFTYFDFMITVPEFGKTKVTPDIYLHCAERLGVSPAKCAVFEDALYAVKSAKSGGFPVIAIEDEYSRCDASEIRDISDIYIKSYKELL